MSEQLFTTDDIFTYGYRKGYKDREKERSYDPHSHDIPPLADTKSNAWISVADDNPTTSDFVFVLLHDRLPALGKYSNEMWEAQSLGTSDINLLDGTRVTHWLPIPQPPKEKGER